jgi:N12 class adenine-specific DNA methylase
MLVHEVAASTEATYRRIVRTYAAWAGDLPFSADSVSRYLLELQRRGRSPYYRRSVRNALVIAHSVGTGKTYSLQTIAMEMRRLKTANKPMIVVQNATLGQFARSFKALYPQANLLIGNEKRTKGDNRAAFIAQATTRDWDAIVIPQSFFEMIENDPKREQDYVQERIAELEDMILKAERDAGNTNSIDLDGSSRSLRSAIGKALMRTRKRYKARLDRVLKRLAESKDDLITFEKMGIDALLVDEAHAYKRGDFYTKMDRVKGLDANGSDRSLDFLMKTQWIHSKTPGRNVILATGTPISNTLAEMWTMLRYVRPDVLQKFGVETFEDFVVTFATVVVDVDETPRGDFRQVLRLAK